MLNPIVIPTHALKFFMNPFIKFTFYTGEGCIVWEVMEPGQYLLRKFEISLEYKAIFSMFYKLTDTKKCKQ